MGDEADLLTGFPFPSIGFTMSGARLLRGSNVKRGAVDWSTDITQHWPAVGANTRVYELQKGDLVIAMDGALVGRSFATIAASDLPALLVQRVARLRSKKSVQGLLRAWVASSFFVRHVDLVKTHTAIPHISPKDIRQFALVVPIAISEQCAIAGALSDVEALLAGLDRLIAKKRDLKQAAVQQLLTGQTRLPGFQGAWKVKRLGDHVRFLKNGTHSRAELTANGVVKNLHYGDIHGAEGVTLNPASMPSLSNDYAPTLGRLADGDLVFVDASEDLDGVGKSVEIVGATNTQFVAGLHTIATRFDSAVLADGFKAYLQFCPPFRHHLRRLAAGTKVYATNRAHVSSVEMQLPSVKEQTAIAAVLSDMDAELTTLETRRAKTRAIKQGMMQELLTGRTRLA